MQKHVNRRSGAAILCVLVCSTLAWLLLGTPSSGINDADIVLVYAQNFLSGHGFAYNVGGEQVEGFPSLLWMLICSAFYIFSRAVERPLMLLNVMFGIITVYICLKRCNQKPTFLLLLCAAPAWFAWCQIAMVESGLWCLLLTATILAVSERNISQCTWLLPLLALTRPESMLWGCWLILVLFIGLGVDRSWRVGLRAVFRPLFAFGMTWTVLVLFRGLYFGSVLPDGSGTPINIGSGILYFLGYLFSNPAALVVVPVFGWVCYREIIRKRWLSKALAVCICLLPGLVIPLMAGTDSFRAFRFYQPIWPLLCLVAAWVMPLLYERQKRLVRRLAPVALLLAGWMIFALPPNLKHEFDMARQSREQGSVLARMFEEHTALPSVGAMSAGACKYGYPGRVYDLKGLTIAKREQNKNRPLLYHAVLDEWFPDILLRSESDAFGRYVFQELRSEPQFQKRYIKGELWYNDEILSAYFSRSFLNGLEDGHYAFSPDLQHALGMEDTPGLFDAVSDEALVSDFSAHDQGVSPFDVPTLWSPPPQL